MKRIFKIILTTFFGLFVALLLAPVIFHDQFIDLVQDKLENYVDAEIEFKDADLSFIRNFPSIHVSFDSLTIKNREPFKDIYLFRSERSSFTTDMKSVLRPKKGITIEGLSISDADMYLITDSLGRTNYDILVEREDEQPEYFGSIEKYTIRRTNIIYEDKTSNMKIILADLDHRGSGKFENIDFDLKTRSKVEAFTLSYRDIQYIKEATLKADMDIGIQLDSQRFVLERNLVELNELDFSLTGHVLNRTEELILDLRIDAPNNAVSDLLSLIPNIMIEDYDDIESEGIASISADINGTYNKHTGSLPLVNVLIQLENGRVKFPQLNVPVENLNARIELRTERPDWKDLRLYIPSFVFQLNEDKLMGNLLADRLFDDPAFKTSIMGDIDIARLSRLFDTEGLIINNGKLTIDMDLQATKSRIMNRAYDEMVFKGSALLTNWKSSTESIGNISITSAAMNFSPKVIEARVADLGVMGTDFNGIINITDPLMLLGGDSQPGLQLDGHSRKLNLDRLAEKAAADTITNGQPVATNAFPDIAIKFDYKADMIVYSHYDMQNLSVNLDFRNDKAKINDASVRLDRNNLYLKGDLANVLKWSAGQGDLEGTLHLETDKLNLDRYLSEGSPGTGASQASAVKLPGNLDIDFFFSVGDLDFKKLNFKALNGTLSLDDGVAVLQNTRSQFYSGDVLIEGKYEFVSDQPFFDFRYQLEKVPFQEMISSSPAFARLAPVAKYIKGVFNSRMVVSGPLNDDLTPRLTEINASGFLETLDGQLSGFKPLVVLGEKLGIEKIKNWAIRDSRNWFEVVDGTVYLKEKDYEFDGMSFKVAGSHSLTNSINYSIKASIPRTKLTRHSIGREIAYSFDNIEQMARDKGINLDLGENIYLSISLTGSLSDPALNIEPTGSGGESIDDLLRNELDRKVKDQREALEREMEKQTEKLKDTLSRLAHEKKETLTGQLEKQADSTIKGVRKELEQKLDSTATGKASQLEDKAKEVFGPQSREQIDSIRSKLNDWNPFKKNKKGN